MLLALLSLAVGSHPVPLGTAWHAVVAFDPADDGQLIVRTLRVPRTLLAVLVGAALGTAGALVQALTRNPLAEPGLLGVNAGAAAAVVTAILALGVSTPLGRLPFALAGSAAAAALVLALGGGPRGGGPGGGSRVQLVLAGTAISVVLAAYTSTVTINEPDVFDVFRLWVVGSLQGRGTDVLLVTAPLVLAGLVLALGVAGSLDALALGADTGAALGASVRRTWVLTAVAVVVLAAAATAAAGPIAFVGLAAPHAARALTGPAHRRLLPVSALLGACTLLAADVVGRVVAVPSEVQAGIVAALVGAPVFVHLVRSRRVAGL
ncbi:FecCD family ABC transporter permease [Cellulomonas oligotrophica]|uniref:Ferric enterobactin transporter FepD n=1 Tax=Cellulomonas oligotrophica TaxID=931536 RepID=A0A7Y9FG33_9CELL|nr:iron ABC transporter permease [Cellulomonas oligotrophica]NYD86367.1 iron complex transport system permease protein [Cellulomonas oligotrophica]GIG32742.1 ferric enterobactin transporter FepD [Cellulomonas oligotrophica]